MSNDGKYRVAAPTDSGCAYGPTLHVSKVRETSAKFPSLQNATAGAMQFMPPSVLDFQPLLAVTRRLVERIASDDTIIDG
jgi:hypothetical protein